MQLEIISRTPPHPRPNRRVPLVFVHGACGGAWIWDEHFLPYFAEQGYEAHAFSLRGHDGSERRAYGLLTGLADYVGDLNEVVQHLGVTPVLIGHSLGGVIVQKWLEHHEARGAVLMGSGPPHGMLPSAISMILRNPILAMQGVLTQLFGPWTVSAAATRKMLFSDGLPEVTVQYRLARGSPEFLRVGCELIWPNFPGPTWNREMPLLVLGTEKDFFVSPTTVEATARVYGTQAEIIPGLAHAMMLEPGWQGVADRILRWLERTRLSSP